MLKSYKKFFSYAICFILFYMYCNIKKENVLNAFMISPFSFEEINKINNYELVAPNYVESTDGINLAYYSFLPDYYEDVVILYHGAGFYCNKTYQHIGYQLKEKYNIACYMIDIRGHGNSEGQRGDSPSKEQVLADVDTFVKFVKTKNENKRIFLVGHSSGAALLLNYNELFGDSKINGYIFISPYLGPMSNTIKKDTRPFASFVKNAKVWLFIFNSVFNINYFKHLPIVYFNNDEQIKKDSFILPYYTYTMSMATTPYNAKDLFMLLKKPFAIYVGSEDEQFIPEKIIEYKNYAKSNDKSIAKIVPNLKHLSIIANSADLINEAIEKL